MNTLVILSSVLLPTVVLAGPAAVEESLRITPPGATDLVPRFTPTQNAEPEFDSPIIVISDWRPSEHSDAEEGKKKTDLFEPAKPLSISEISQTEEKKE